jgi:hypothetical protein
MKLADLGPTSKAECKMAIRFQFKPIPDVRRGRGWYKFVKGNRSIWLAAVPGGTRPPRWVTADMVDGQYINHAYHDQLADAIHHPLGEQHSPV